MKQGLKPATATDVAGLVDYAEGAVVSRTLVKNEAGTLTLFAFDRGQELSEHTAPFDATVLVVDGRVDLTIGGEPVEARAGQIVRMPANVPHAVRAPEPFKMMLIMMREPGAGRKSPDEGTA